MSRAPPAPVSTVPFLPQEDAVRKVSPVMFHPEGAPTAAPDFDPEAAAAEPDAPTQLRAAAVEEGLRLQAQEAE